MTFNCASKYDNTAANVAHTASKAGGNSGGSGGKYTWPLDVFTWYCAGGGALK
jgi:hypothetical protein